MITKKIIDTLDKKVIFECFKVEQNADLYKLHFKLKEFKIKLEDSYCLEIFHYKYFPSEKLLTLIILPRNEFLFKVYKEAIHNSFKLNFEQTLITSKFLTRLCGNTDFLK